MPTVIRLPDTLISQIAAGEVIERPASVVKELVENAIDAGAHRIEVELDEGGLLKLVVTDDGCGMLPEDAALALERHATSKLRTPEDLFALHTLGFRGEALPSIASVSRFELVTRTAQSDAATRLVVEGGERSPPEPAAAPVGTRITIKDLFFNQPARRKFQKSPATEQTHSVNTVLRLALARPEIRFIVRSQKRTLLDIPATTADNTRDRIAVALGKELGPRLYPVEHEQGGVRVSGFAADPECQAGDARNLYCYVNGRYVRDRLLQRAVLEGYRSLLPHGRYPTVVINLELAPDAVDVNVHPQKFEVRFREGQNVFSAVLHSLAGVLAKTPWLERGGAQLPSATVARSFAPSYGGSSFQAQSFGASQALAGAPLSQARQMWAPPAANIADQARWRQLFEQNVRPDLQALREDATIAAEQAPTAPHDRPAALITGGYFSQLRVLAQFANLYILCQGDGELVVVDQHAAHERITFEKLLNAWESGTVARQRLLFPVTLEARPDVVQLVEEHGPALERLGLELAPFGEATLALTAIPAVASERKARGLVEEIVAELGDASRVAGAEFAHALLARIACHSAVRSGDPLTQPEMEALLRQLDAVDCAIRCPHGRPVVARVRTEQIGRWFERP